MAENRLFSVDRIEDDLAVLIDENGMSCTVPLSVLQAAETGDMYRKVGENFVRDPDAEQARRARIQALQNRLRRGKN